MRKKDSLVWRFFNEVDRDSAVCKLCYKKYSRKGRGTGSLRSHLKSMHPNEYITLRTEEFRIMQLHNKEGESQAEQKDCPEADNKSSFCFVATEGQPTTTNYYQQQVKVEYCEDDSGDDDYSDPEHSKTGPSRSKKSRLETSSDTDYNIVTESITDSFGRKLPENSSRHKLRPEKRTESDAVDVFFSSMALTVKKLHPVLAAKCKAEICNVVTKWELLALEPDKTSPSQSTD